MRAKKHGTKSGIDAPFRRGFSFVMFRAVMSTDSGNQDIPPMPDDLATFDIRTSRDMLDKFLRELKRLDDAESREDAADHCFNAAITAWHLYEWVWRDIRKDYALQAKLASLAGVSVQQFNKQKLKAFVQSSETGCSDIRYCRIIANASKHGGVELTDDDPTDLRPYGSPYADSRWKVRVRGEVLIARFIFEEAFRFWNVFIRDHGIAEEGFGKLHPTASMPK